MTQTSLLPSAPRSALQIAGASLRLYKRGLLKVLPLCALYFLILFALQSFQQMQLHSPSVEPLGFANFIFAILNFAVQPLIMAAVIFTLHQFVIGASVPNFRNALGFCGRHFPSIIFAYILYILVLIIGLVAVVIPGIFFIPLFSLFYIFIVVENKTAYQSLKASAKLVWGHWWHSALVILLCILSYIVLGILALIVVFILDSLLVVILPHLSAHLNVNGIAHNVGVVAAMFIVATLFTPLFGSFLLELYYDLRLRKGV